MSEPSANSLLVRKFGIFLNIAVCLMIVTSFGWNRWYNFSKGHTMGLWRVCYLETDKTSTFNKTSSSTIIPTATSRVKEEDIDCEGLPIDSLSGAFHAVRGLAALSAFCYAAGLLFGRTCETRIDHRTCHIGEYSNLVGALMLWLAVLIFQKKYVYEDYRYGSSAKGNMGWCFYLALVAVYTTPISVLFLMNHTVAKKLSRLKLLIRGCSDQSSGLCGGPLRETSIPENSTPSRNITHSLNSRVSPSSTNRSDRNSSNSNSSTGDMRSGSLPNIFVVSQRTDNNNDTMTIFINNSREWSGSRAAGNSTHDNIPTSNGREIDAWLPPSYDQLEINHITSPPIYEDVIRMTANEAINGEAPPSYEDIIKDSQSNSPAV